VIGRVSRGLELDAGPSTLDDLDPCAQRDELAAQVVRIRDLGLLVVQVAADVAELGREGMRNPRLLASAARARAAAAATCALGMDPSAVRVR